MARVFKTEMYILDIYDDFETLDDLLNYLDYKLPTYGLTFKPFNTTSVDVEWDDDIDLNYTDIELNTYEKYFNS